MRLFDIQNRRQTDSCPLNSLQAEYIIQSIEATTKRVQRVEKLVYIAIALIITVGVSIMTEL